MIVDVRTKAEFDAGHVCGAVHLPLADIEAGKNPDNSFDAKISLYCRSGARSQAAMVILQRRGFTDVVNVGGLQDALTSFGACVPDSAQSTCGDSC